MTADDDDQPNTVASGGDPTSVDETAAAATELGLEPGTEILPSSSATGDAAVNAWSLDETDDLDAPTERHTWRSTWTNAALLLLSAAVVAVVIGIGGWTWLNLHHTKPRPESPARTAPAAALTPAPAPPPASSPIDDDEFVAMAISPRAILTTSPHKAGYGTAGNQNEANQIALSECRVITGDDGCLLVNAGMYHGCVSYALDPSARQWAGGSGADPDAASADARTRLGSPGAPAAEQCSTPPGVIKPSSAPAPRTGN